MSTLQRAPLTTVAVCAAAMMVVSTTWARSKGTDPNNCAGKAWVAYFDCTRAGMSDKVCADIYNRTLSNCFARTKTSGATAQDIAPPPTAPKTATPSTTVSPPTTAANTSLKSKGSAFTVSPPTTAANTSLKSKGSAFTVQTTLAKPVANDHSKIGVTIVPKWTAPTPSASIHIASAGPVISHSGKQGTPNGITAKRDGKR